jgi:dUTPase
VVVLPKGWELVECASPGIVSTDTDGRIRVSFLNDRDDQLPVKIVARRLP